MMNGTILNARADGVWVLNRHSYFMPSFYDWLGLQSPCGATTDRNIRATPLLAPPSAPVTAMHSAAGYLFLYQATLPGTCHL